jgi:hypothetical protein
VGNSSHSNGDVPRDRVVREGAASNNVMVLSWLTPTNNQGRFAFSINKSRYSASLLAPLGRRWQTVGGKTATTMPTGVEKEAHGNDVDTDETGEGTTTTFESNDEKETDVYEYIIIDSYQTGIEFTLSVPTRGMEQVLLDVLGSISGQNRSKFPSPPGEGKIRGSCHQSNVASTGMIMNDEGGREVDEKESLSGRRRKKLRRQQLSENGVSGLNPIPLGHAQPRSDLFPFVIEGTVAHLLCRTYAVIGSTHSHPRTSAPPELPTSMTLERTAVTVDDGWLFHKDAETTPMHQPASPMIDEDHLLILAEVTDAYVHPSYWDDAKSIFRPLSEAAPPYMTFLGSQTFG